jgi:pyruvate formate lyase activating enzyme
MNNAPLKELCSVLDAANVDLKAFSEETYSKLTAGKLSPVLQTLSTLKDQKIWFEITALIVPTYTDNIFVFREMCQWIIKNLGPDYPLHSNYSAPQIFVNLSHLWISG